MLRLLRREGLIEAYEHRPIGRMIRAGLKSELKTARHALRPRPPVRFVIFAQGRTGSTLLTSTLDTHPQITCLDEILGQPRAMPQRFVENAARGSGARAFGFHVKIYQLTCWQRVDDVGGWLAAMRRRGWKILYLRREHLLRHVVSNVFAEAAGTYHHRDGTKTARPERITLPVERLRQGIDGRRRNLAAERAALAALRRLGGLRARHRAARAAGEDLRADPGVPRRGARAAAAVAEESRGKAARRADRELRRGAAHVGGHGRRGVPA